MTTQAPEDDTAAVTVELPRPRLPQPPEASAPSGPAPRPAPVKRRLSGLPIGAWIALGAIALIGTLLLGVSTGVAIGVASSKGQSGASPSSSGTSPIPFTPAASAMKDYRGWTMQGAILDLNSLGVPMTLTNPAAANSLVGSQTPAPGTSISAATSGVQLIVGSAAPAPTAPVAAPSPAPVPTVDPTPASTVSAGVYAVGTEIAPGTYSTPGGSYCYWARLKAADGELNSISANQIVQGPGTMTVKASDKYIELSGACTWTKK